MVQNNNELRCTSVHEPSIHEMALGNPIFKNPSLCLTYLDNDNFLFEKLEGGWSYCVVCVEKRNALESRMW